MPKYSFGIIIFWHSPWNTDNGPRLCVVINWLTTNIMYLFRTRWVQTPKRVREWCDRTCWYANMTYFHALLIETNNQFAIALENCNSRFASHASPSGNIRGTRLAKTIDDSLIFLIFGALTRESGTTNNSWHPHVTGVVRYWTLGPDLLKIYFEILTIWDMKQFLTTETKSNFRYSYAP